MKSKKTIYIHIGTPKTGSSAIQAFLKLNADLLQEKGYLYPNPPEFGQPYQTSPGNAVFIKNLFDNNNYEEFKNTLSSFDKNVNIILSSESIANTINKHKDRFFKEIESYNYKIIVYLRRQDHHLSSMYNQLVKNHSFKKNPLNLNVGKHVKLVLSLADYTDISKVIVRPYEKEQFWQGNIFADFLNAIGLELTDEYLMPERVVNPSLCFEALEFRKIINSFDIANDGLAARIPVNRILADYTVSKNLGEPFLDNNILSTEERIKLIDSFAEDNAKVAKIFLNRDNGSLFYEKLPEEDNNTKDLSIEKSIEICDYFLKKSMENDYSEDIMKSIITDVLVHCIDENKTCFGSR